MIYAIVDQSDLVVNIIFWDGESQWAPPENCIAVQLPSDSLVTINWSYIDGEFIPPQ